MNMIIFKNEGEIDPMSIKTFGVSVKETENPIGYFGTGLKYSIAILLREGCDIKIYSGETVYEFDIKKQKIRGVDFNVITMNGEDLPFTTELGKNWEMWQAFREIYCNTLDEKGSVKKSMLLPLAIKGHTYIIVKGPEFEKAYENRNQIVLSLDESSRLLKTNELEVYNKPSKNIYYRGVRVANLEEEAMYTYNILGSLELTEDRTVKYEHTAISYIPRNLCMLKDKYHIRKILLSPRDNFESNLNFDQLLYWGERVTEEFKEVLEQEYNQNNDRLNQNAISYLRRQMNKRASKHYKETTLNEVETLQLSRCQTIARKIYQDFDDYRVMVVETLGQNTMALADEPAKTMVISRECFQKGTKYLLSTMIEEYAHLKTGYEDHSRQLQTWLFDNICTIVENHVTREPI